jgi:hypothetical protein
VLLYKSSKGNTPRKKEVAQMKKYRGYYIDKIVFNNEAEIDAFIKKQEVDRFIKLNNIFASHMTMEASIACSEQADRLHNQFNFSWEEIEAMEIEAIA